MLEAIDASTAMIRFYEVDYDLNMPSSKWLDRIQAGDMVILIDYFGFPGDVAWKTHIKQRGAWILEDAAQSLLSGRVGQLADFVVFSPRKFVGVPDGGILIVNCEIDFSTVRLEKPPAKWWLRALSASVLRREFDIYGGSRYWFDLFQEVETGVPIGAYAMSELSWTLLRYGFDYLTIAQRRVDNYRVLLNKLGNIALFTYLPENVVPSGFPIRVKHRDSLRQILFDNQIYPPVHWPARGIIPEEFSASHKLANEIMTLPCDQRYGGDDMERMADIILKGLR
jgi:dTDP-4-amino-4,6-dideoxygalactose transaminase